MGSVATTQTGRYAGKVESPRLLKMEQEFLASGGEWKKIIAGDLFSISRGNIQNQMALVESKNGVSFIAQNDTENGFVKKVEQGNNKLFEGNSIVIGRQTGVVYFQPDNFITTDGVLVLTLSDKTKMAKSFGFFLVSTLRKSLQYFGYTNTVSAQKLNSLEIQLPFSNGKIAFDFIENFVSELQASRLRELQNYLKVTGLANYELSDEERKIIEQFDELLTDLRGRGGKT